MPESNVSITHYSNWLAQTGVETEVLPKIFIKYMPGKFETNGQYYSGQKWRCQMPDGSRKVLIFREPWVDDNESVDSDITSYNERLELNPILHTRAEMENPSLIHKRDDGLSKEDKQKIKTLHRAKTIFPSIAEGCVLKEKLIKSPTLPVVNKWNDWKRDNPSEFELLKDVTNTKDKGL